MKFYGIKDIDGFFEAIGECKGTVELVTADGDRLNLKSRLCQYISFAKIVAGDSIPEMEIIASDKEDNKRLLEFMMTKG